MEKDLYEILGVGRSATETEIQTAFRGIAKKNHPDVNPSNKQAEQRFKEASLAYEVLRDPKKRAQYDQMRMGGFQTSGTGGQRAPFGPEMFSDLGLGDLFSEIFGSGFSRGGPQSRSSYSERGRDKNAVLPVSFLEAANGGEKTFEMSDGKRLSVKLPAGIETGSKIKLSGQGMPGMGRAPSGDLVLEVEVRPHPYFEIEGLNIVLKCPISFSEAVLGGDVEVPTISGRVVLKIPPGVSSGARLKLTGKGIRSIKSGRSGDQLVELLIKIPKNDSAYIEAAQKLPHFNPRSDLFSN